MPTLDVHDWPYYTAHRTVHAINILSVVRLPDGRAQITPHDAQYPAFIVTAAFVTQWQPQAGGYYAVHDDGYASFSPQRAFDAYYRRITS